MGMSCAAAGVGDKNENTSRQKKIRKKEESFAARRRALDGFPSPRALARTRPGMTRFLLLNADLTSGGPDHALAHGCCRRHALVVEALDAFSFIGFGRVQIAL